MAIILSIAAICLAVDRSSDDQPIFDLSRFHSSPQIFDHMKRLAKENEKYSVIDLGGPEMALYGLKIIHSPSNPFVLIECGKLGNDFESVQTCASIIDDHRLSNQANYLIVPLLNPSGQ